MKTLLAGAVIGLALIGCSGQPADRRAPAQFPDWAREPRELLVTAAGALPQATLVSDEQQLARDTVVGAGSGALKGAGMSLYVGCFLLTDAGDVAGAEGAALLIALVPCAVGLAVAPYAAALGSVIGGARGAAESEPVETPRPLHELRAAASLLRDAADRRNPESLLVRAVIDSARQRTDHALRVPPRESPIVTARTGAELHAAMGDLHADGILVLRFSRLGFRYRGSYEHGDSDPELALLMGATADVYFVTGDCLKKAVFADKTHRGGWHRLSDLGADDGALLDREMHALADRLAQHLVSVVLTRRESEQVTPVTNDQRLRPGRPPTTVGPFVDASGC